MSIFARANELKKKRNNKKGFTLVELVVVLVILAILMAILVPSLIGYINKAKNSQVEANARAVYIATQATVAELLKNNPEVTSKQVEGKISDIYELAEVNNIATAVLATETASGAGVVGVADSVFTFDGNDHAGVKITGFTWKQDNKKITLDPTSGWGEVEDVPSSN